MQQTKNNIRAGIDQSQHWRLAAMQALVTMCWPIAAFGWHVDFCSDIEISDAGPDTVARIFHTASRLNDETALITGGMGLQLIPPSLFSRDTINVLSLASGEITDSFQPFDGGDPVVVSLLKARSSHTQTTLEDGRVLITGGSINASGTSPGTPTASVELFDPCTGTISFGPDMSQARTSHTATTLNDGRVLVAGYLSWQMFDPSTDSWSTPVNLIHSRVAHAAAQRTVDGHEFVYVIGGGGTGGDTIERLDPTTNTSTLMPVTLPSPVDDLAALALDDHQLLLVGGQELSTGNTIAATLVFDAKTQTLSALASPPDLPNGIADHVTCKIGNTVLLAGGETQIAGEDVVNEFLHVFDLASQTWCEPVPMQQGHDDCASVVFEDSLILVGGGVSFFGQELPTTPSERVTLALPSPDFNDDGIVNAQDLLVLLKSWGVCRGTCHADLDCNGDVGVSDLLIFLSAWS